MFPTGNLPRPLLLRAPEITRIIGLYLFNAAVFNQRLEFLLPLYGLKLVSMFSLTSHLTFGSLNLISLADCSLRTLEMVVTW